MANGAEHFILIDFRCGLYMEFKGELLLALATKSVF